MKSLTQKLKEVLKNKEIIDVIIFGSRAKQKLRPNDIDIAVLMKDKDLAIRSKIKELIPQADVMLLTLEDIHKSIFLTIIKEGYSLRKEQYLHNLYGIQPVKLFRYDLKRLTLSKKVMFERAIKKIEGITRLSNRVILVPLNISGEFEDFLRHWDLDIEATNYELIPLQRKEEF